MKLNLLVLVLALTACAPEPTTPSDESLAGTWSSTAHLFGVSNIRMQIVQEPEGIVSGKWFAHGDAGAGDCPQTTPCELEGSIIGRNTVAQVEIELLRLGQFEGALVETNAMRGIFALGETFETITFTRGTATIQ